MSMSSVPMCCPGNRYQTPPEVVRLHRPSAHHPQASRRHASPLFSAPFTSTRPPPTCSPASGARADAGGAVAPHRHSCIDGSRLDTVILQCHCLSFLRGVHSNLPVIAVICSQNDRVAPGYCKGWPLLTARGGERRAAGAGACRRHRGDASRGRHCHFG